MEPRVRDPQVFIEALREFHGTPGDRRGELANALSELIITKRVDLAAVRHLLMDEGAVDLLETLDQLLDVIEPYIEEGGVDE